MTRDSLLPPDWPGGWPPSNYPILLAILLLVATALALLISTEAVANQLATSAYLALVAGIVIRFIEYATEQRLKKLIQRLVVEFISAFDTAQNLSGGAIRQVNRPSRSRRLAKGPRDRGRRIARNITIGTAMGGIFILLVRSLEPNADISHSLLLSWTIALWLTGSAYIINR